MSTASITLAASDGAQDRADALWAAITRTWGPDAPEPRRMDAADLADALLDDEADAPPGGIALVVLDEHAPRATVVALAHMLRDALIAGYVQLPALDADLRREVSGGGLLAIDRDAAAAEIAEGLRALASRQEAVGMLQRELRILSSFQGGAKQEMDRLHEELNLAAAIQQELLPAQLPQPEGLECGALFRPASYVSGDIYDVTQIDDDRLAFFVADAVGHGVPAALLTMVISRSLRSGAATRSPAEAITALNADLVRAQRGRSRFATAVCGTIDVRSREVTLCTAGHPPALLFGEHGMTPIESGGALLGVFEGEPYEQTSFTLERGQTLVLYSDGFEMAFPDGGEAAASDVYLREFAALPWSGQDRQGTTDAALQKLAERVDCQAGSLHQRDDLTVLAIAAQPESGAGRRAA
ncbi:MAG: PP2C family protein-serine/threonine phosphatase [Planctomycetota bacterium]